MKSAKSFALLPRLLLISIWLTPLCLVLVSTQKAFAASSNNFQLQILPLDCVFEIVNDGLNTVHYLTPEKCLPSLPSSNQPPSTGQQFSSSQAHGKYRVAGLFGSSNIPGQTSNLANGGEAYDQQSGLGEFTTIKQSHENSSSSSDSSVTAGLAAVTILAVIISLVLLLSA